jgi:hypothetical protein
MRRSLQMASSLLAAYDDGPAQRTLSFSRASACVCQHSQTGDTGMPKGGGVARRQPGAGGIGAFPPSRSRSKAPATAADSHAVDWFFGINA